MYAIRSYYAISIGIIDNDNSTLSNSYREFIENSGKYNMNEINAEEMNEKISTGEIAFCAAIPESFQASILKGENAKIEIYSIKGTEVTAWVDNFTTIYMQNIAKLSLVADGDIDKFTSMVNSIKDGEVKLLKTELQDELIGKYALKQIIGLLLFFMMMASATTASFIIRITSYNVCYTKLLRFPHEEFCLVDGGVFCGNPSLSAYRNNFV